MKQGHRFYSYIIEIQSHYFGKLCTGGYPEVTGCADEELVSLQQRGKTSGFLALAGTHDLVWCLLQDRLSNRINLVPNYNHIPVPFVM